MRQLVLDALIVVLAYELAVLLRFAGDVPEHMLPWGTFGLFLLLALAAHVGLNLISGIYQIVNRFVSLAQAVLVLQTALGATAVLLVLVLVLPTKDRIAPLSVVLAGGVWTGIGMVVSRFYYRIKKELRRRAQTMDPEVRLLIVGAGEAGNMISREIQRNPSLKTEIVGFVDDNRRLTGMRVNGGRVFGTIDDLPRVVEEKCPNELLIAIPSASPPELARIHRICRSTGLVTQTLPNLGQLVNGEASLGDIRDLRIEDFLGRERVQMDLESVAGHISGKRVLVTGAAGSIGSELVRQVSRFDPAELILIDKDESSLYHLHEQLRKRGVDRYFIHPTSVALPKKMESLFRQHRPEVVFHAAAYKHVPLMELHPDEAIVNNVKGTLIVAELAGRFSVERMVNISTDKAVDPINVMGATKRVGERVMDLMTQCFPDTHFTSVRFGNVLGSRGSVIPVFQQQIEAGGPVTVTHPEMTRYFMTIEEAVQLVLEASFLNGGSGDPAGPGAYVLEMGEPVKIVDLAARMISLLGNGSEEEIEIRFTGLRPGEKLHEELASAGEKRLPTEHPKIFFATVENPDRQTNPEEARTAGDEGDTDASERVHFFGRRSGDAIYACATDSLFLRRLQRLIGLAEKSADYTELLGALRSCAPEYTPFNWNEIELTGPATVWQPPRRRTPA